VEVFPLSALPKIITNELAGLISLLSLAEN